MLGESNVKFKERHARNLFAWLICYLSSINLCYVELRVTLYCTRLSQLLSVMLRDTYASRMHHFTGKLHYIAMDTDQTINRSSYNMFAFALRCQYHIPGQLGTTPPERLCFSTGIGVRRSWSLVYGPTWKQLSWRHGLIRLVLLQLVAQPRRATSRPLKQGIVTLSGLRLTLGWQAVESNGGLCSRLKRTTRDVSCIPKWATIERLRLGWGF
jgi:hypothetical protein